MVVVVVGPGIVYFCLFSLVRDFRRCAETGWYSAGLGVAGVVRGQITIVVHGFVRPFSTGFP